MLAAGAAASAVGMNESVSQARWQRHRQERYIYMPVTQTLKQQGMADEETKRNPFPSESHFTRSILDKGLDTASPAKHILIISSGIEMVKRASSP